MDTKNKYNPQPAKIFAACVYVGVVLAASTLFISFVLTAFPADAYLSRGIMVVAGLMIGASSIAFPVALHSWTIEKSHLKQWLEYWLPIARLMFLPIHAPPQRRRYSCRIQNSKEIDVVFFETKKEI